MCPGAQRKCLWLLGVLTVEGRICARGGGVGELGFGQCGMRSWRTRSAGYSDALWRESRTERWTAAPTLPMTGSMDYGRVIVKGLLRYVLRAQELSSCSLLSAIRRAFACVFDGSLAMCSPPIGPGADGGSPRPPRARKPRPHALCGEVGIARRRRALVFGGCRGRGGDSPGHQRLLNSVRNGRHRCSERKRPRLAPGPWLNFRGCCFAAYAVPHGRAACWSRCLMAGLLTSCP